MPQVFAPVLDIFFSRMWNCPRRELASALRPYLGFFCPVTCRYPNLLWPFLCTLEYFPYVQS